ncbi:nuclear transport factor 2 family protein [Novosphingobium humi]|uniref:Nuclear transport factor 2 family protein n=1 Tax=Novosphingobium humi TaxID=2282397 RepID=A0ABY7U6L5_9SPHN|nr:nuclear transport factor 2 family protein [Novosphingobium humi]WCT80215.1 nuclear transport factor 2 family protein [Novosphingobium humi]WJT01159.1 nuclear transport factor 2 family protein [Novosphingobium humi]
MTPDEMIAFVDELYELTGTGQWDAAAERLTEDFVAIEADGLPMEGAYHGKNGLYDLFVKVMGMMDVVAMERVETTAGRDHAVTILSLRFADPALKPAELCEVFRFRDGKCCQIKPYYFDPATIHAAVAAKARGQTQ